MRSLSHVGNHGGIRELLNYFAQASVHKCRMCSDGMSRLSNGVDMRIKFKLAVCNSGDSEKIQSPMSILN